MLSGLLVRVSYATSTVICTSYNADLSGYSVYHAFIYPYLYVFLDYCDVLKEYNEYNEIEALSLVLSMSQRRLEFQYEIFLFFFSKYIIFTVEFVEGTSFKHWGGNFRTVINVITTI